MIIYLDADYKCYTENADGRRAVEADAFDGKERSFIEGHRYVPSGETWTRSDGVTFRGEMISALKDYNAIMVDVALGYLDDEQAESVTVLFPAWEVGALYAVGDRRQYDGLLYRCVQAHTSQVDWTPDAVPALWVRTSTEEWPEWVQPTGAQDAYNKGDKVTYKGEHYISLIDANVYSPEAYPAGWEKQ